MTCRRHDQSYKTISAAILRLALLCVLRGLANPNFLLEIEAIAAV